MPDNSRIEDLRKRYHENPRRFFAPLANEYRKSGMLDRALLLCQKHVGEQPENMNGLIVYGQTLFELQQHEASREPFEQALRLDPENLIALRHLGDIARLTGDAPAAKGWYERVLELDRRNDEVLDLLAQLGGDASAESAPPARPSTTAGGLVSVATPAPPSKRASLLDISFDFGEPTAPAADATLGLEPTIAAPEARPLPEAPAGDFELAELSTEVAPLAGLEATAFTSEQVAPSARARPRMTKRDLASLPLLADFGLDDESVTDVRRPAANHASKATPTFATETMAALYLRQGLIAEAIGVYQQLIEVSPDNAGLRAKLAELERMQGQASAGAAASPADEMPEFEPPVDVREPAPAPANAAMADVSFGGIGLRGQGSVTPLVTPAFSAGPDAREFFAAFARRAAAVGGAAEPSVEAQAVATTGWPLDALFGAADDVRDLHAAGTLAGVSTFAGPDGGTGIDALLAPETAPPRRSVPRASETLKFDQFFQKPGTAAEPAPVESADPDDDLDQFQDWLKGLQQ